MNFDAVKNMQDDTSTNILSDLRKLIRLCNFRDVDVGSDIENILTTRRLCNHILMEIKSYERDSCVTNLRQLTMDVVLMKNYVMMLCEMYSNVLFFVVSENLISRLDRMFLQMDSLPNYECGSIYFS